MHSIGRDDDGGYIVRLTLDEMSAFLSLGKAIEGKCSGDDVADTLENQGFPEVSTALGCVMRYAHNLLMLNDAKASIEAAIASFKGEGREAQ